MIGSYKSAQNTRMYKNFVSRAFSLCHLQSCNKCKKFIYIYIYIYKSHYGPIAGKKLRHADSMRIGSVETDLCIMYFLSVPHRSFLLLVVYILSDARTHYQLQCADEP